MARSRRTCWMTPASSRRGCGALLRRHRAARRRARGARRRAGDGCAPRRRSADVRWVDPSAMHLTLKFLGAVPDERVAAVAARSAAVGRGACAHRAGVRRAGRLPGPARPRVVWAGVTGGLARARAARGRGRAARWSRWVSRPRRGPFAAHVTLGRVRSPRGRGASRRASARPHGADFGAWTVTEVVLYPEPSAADGGALRGDRAAAARRGLLADGA